MGLGYGEREARFLYIVAVAAHSGYFLRRQYETFAGLARGASGSRFLQRAVAAQHIRSIPHSNRTEVFHLFSRPVYRAIGAEDNGNRRQRPHYSVKAKVMTLDFVLARRDRWRRWFMWMRQVASLCTRATSGWRSFNKGGCRVLGLIRSSLLGFLTSSASSEMS